MVPSSAASGSCGSPVKNSITPSTPRALRIGKQNAACRPARRAACVRGKLASEITSAIGRLTAVPHTAGQPFTGREGDRSAGGFELVRFGAGRVPGLDAAQGIRPVRCGLPDGPEPPTEALADRPKRARESVARLDRLGETPRHGLLRPWKGGHR